MSVFGEVISDAQRGFIYGLETGAGFINTATSALSSVKQSVSQITGKPVDGAQAQALAQQQVYNDAAAASYPVMDTGSAPLVPAGDLKSWLGIGAIMLVFLALMKK